MADRRAAIRWARPLLVVAAGAALAGCGGKKASSLPTVLQAVRTTLGGSSASTLTLAGASAFGAPHRTLSGQGEFALDDGIGYQSVDVAGGRVTIVYAPQEVYLQPTFATRLPATKEWVAATVTSSRNPRSDVARFVEQAESLSPQLLLDEVRWGGVDAIAHGRETVGKARLVRYDVDVDLARAARTAARRGSPAERVALEQELAGSSSHRTTVTVLIDPSSARVARIRAAAPGAGVGAATVDLTALKFRFASEPPADGQVAQLSSLSSAYAATVRSPWTGGSG